MPLYEVVVQALLIRTLEVEATDEKAAKTLAWGTIDGDDTYESVEVIDVRPAEPRP